MRLSQNIAGLRHAAGWSQEELAARLDVTRQSVSKWESGQSVPDAERLVKLSELFGVSVDFLLKGDGPPAGDAPPAASAARLVTAGEAADYLALRGRAAGRIAAGTCLCILSPVCLLLLMCFCMGLGMMLSALTVFFRDVMHLWSVVITAWTYITPIFWTTDFVAQMPHLVRILVYANPMYNYLQFMRDIFLFQTTPSLLTFGMCVAWAVLALAIGYTVFHKSERKFILYI